MEKWENLIIIIHISLQWSLCGAFFLVWIEFKLFLSTNQSRVNKINCLNNNCTIFFVLFCFCWFFFQFYGNWFVSIRVCKFFSLWIFFFVLNLLRCWVLRWVLFFMCVKTLHILHSYKNYCVRIKKILLHRDQIIRAVYHK